MKKQDNFVKEVVSFLKKFLVSRKQLFQQEKLSEKVASKEKPPEV